VTKTLAGTAALVTGASSGIGAATASALAAQGAAVALVARRADRLYQVKADIESAGGTALAVTADVTDAEEVAAAVQRTVDELGRLDTVVNNAGLMRMARLPKRRCRIGTTWCGSTSRGSCTSPGPRSRT
jgi:NADP-dependent 3-hydroxy acid dehydrogenase YdfG